MSEPNEPYGGYGELPQPYLYNVFDQAAEPPTPVIIATAPPPAPRKPRPKMWIMIGVIAAVYLAGFGTGFAFFFTLYTAPAGAVGTFCDDLKKQEYPAAYGLFSSSLKSQFTQVQFTQGSRALDQAEGTVTDCKPASGNPYSYSLFTNIATVNVVITRSTWGELQGTVHLKDSWWNWTIDSLDTSLLGVNLGALKTADTYCAALQSQNYTAAYALLGAQPQAKISQADFVQEAQLHDQIDGNITTCGVVGITPGARDTLDTLANLTVSTTRTKLSGERPRCVSEPRIERPQGHGDAAGFHCLHQRQLFPARWLWRLLHGLQARLQHLPGVRH